MNRRPAKSTTRAADEPSGGSVVQTTGGRILHEKSSQDENTSSYAIAGGTARESTRGGRSEMVASLPDGGRVLQHAEHRQSEYESNSQLPLTAARSGTTKNHRQQQQQEQQRVHQSSSQQRRVFSSHSQTSTSSRNDSVDHSGSVQGRLAGQTLPHQDRLFETSSMIDNTLQRQQQQHMDSFDQQQKEFERQCEEMMSQQRQQMSHAGQQLTSADQVTSGQQQMHQKTMVKSHQSVQRQTSSQKIVSQHQCQDVAGSSSSVTDTAAAQTM